MKKFPNSVFIFLYLFFLEIPILSGNFWSFLISGICLVIFSNIRFVFSLFLFSGKLLTVYFLFFEVILNFREKFWIYCFWELFWTWNFFFIFISPRISLIFLFSIFLNIFYIPRFFSVFSFFFLFSEFFSSFPILFILRIFFIFFKFWYFKKIHTIIPDNSRKSKWKLVFKKKPDIQ